MRLKNFTNIPNDRIKEMIRHTKPNGVANFDITIKNAGPFKMYGAYAYVEGCAYHEDSSRLLVTISITRNENKFPYLMHENGYLDSLVLSREECLIDLMAHELRHLWQKSHKRGRVWGSRGKYSDRDADAYAIRKVRQWRRLHQKEVNLSE